MPDLLAVDPPVPIAACRDSYGNWVSRIVAPPGLTRISTTAVLRDSGIPDPVFPDAQQHQVQDLPEETLLFLLPSRYCETELLTETAWRMFERTPPGWARVQAVCDFVRHHIHFDYMQARATRTAWEAFNEGVGVCRDYTPTWRSRCAAA